MSIEFNFDSSVSKEEMVKVLDYFSLVYGHGLKITGGRTVEIPKQVASQTLTLFVSRVIDDCVALTEEDTEEEYELNASDFNDSLKEGDRLLLRVTAERLPPLPPRSITDFISEEELERIDKARQDNTTGPIEF